MRVRRGGVIGAVEPDGADVLQPGHQPEPEEFGEGEPDDRGAVRRKVARSMNALVVAGPAGLSAALHLARYNRSVLVVDSGASATTPTLVNGQLVERLEGRAGASYLRPALRA